MSAGLRLPVGVHDRDPLPADVAVIPHPCLRIDRFADRSQHPKGRKVILPRPLFTESHQRANRGRRRIELVHAMLIDDVPKTPGVGIRRNTLEHDGRSSKGKRTVNHVAVSGDPPDVGGTEEDILVVIVESVLERNRGEEQVPARRMQHTFRLPGRP
ncbi:MAG: hypothetical protein DDT34_02481 [Firmicutes bacterium]|nr:hypothetical protein [Bacillota bacterium]